MIKEYSGQAIATLQNRTKLPPNVDNVHKKQQLATWRPRNGRRHTTDVAGRRSALKFCVANGPIERSSMSACSFFENNTNQALRQHQPEQSARTLEVRAIRYRRVVASGPLRSLRVFALSLMRVYTESFARRDTCKTDDAGLETLLVLARQDELSGEPLPRVPRRRAKRGDGVFVCVCVCGSSASYRLGPI